MGPQNAHITMLTKSRPTNRLSRRVICGVLVSANLALSGCGTSDTNEVASKGPGSASPATESTTRPTVGLPTTVSVSTESVLPVPSEPSSTTERLLPTPVPTTDLVLTTTTVAAETTSSGEPTFEPEFTFVAMPISESVRQRIQPSSWREGCPVGLEDLRYVTLRHFNFDGEATDGELIVHSDALNAIESAFRAAFADRFPIERMELVDNFGGSDYESIEANNTSAFNCRLMTGSETEWSEHAYGKAIDINPIQNPYVSRSGITSHERSIEYLDRTDRPGVITGSDPISHSFIESGWGWGGTWESIKDYQHFSASGR